MEEYENKDEERLARILKHNIDLENYFEDLQEELEYCITLHKEVNMKIGNVSPKARKTILETLEKNARRIKEEQEFVLIYINKKIK